MEFTRRRLLTAAAATGATALAGCVGGGDETEASGETAATASFFVFGDVAEQVAGDAAAADLLVPVGQHGHGWEPGPRVRGDIRDADLLVHGMTGFQPWVDDVLTDLDADGADVATVDASADVELLPADGEHSHDETGHDGTESHDHMETEHHGTEHHETEHHETEHHETEHHDEDDHGNVDPHFWMDPTRLATAAGTVEAAFAEIDAEHADAYADNAAAYRESLTDLDAEIEGVVDDADLDTLLVAGHNSFGYLEDRYGVHVESLTGLSPDDRPTTRDIQHAQEVVEEHGLQYVCADPLESQEAAEQLVAETGAEAVLPLTAMPGLVEEWSADDWGYVDVMTEVNLPTLERGLSA